MGGEVAGGEVVAVGAELGLEVSTQRPVPKLRLRYRGGGGGGGGGGACALTFLLVGGGGLGTYAGGGSGHLEYRAELQVAAGTEMTARVGGPGQETVLSLGSRATFTAAPGQD